MRKPQTLHPRAKAYVMQYLNKRCRIETNDARLQGPPPPIPDVDDPYGEGSDPYAESSESYGVLIVNGVPLNDVPYRKGNISSMQIGSNDRRFSVFEKAIVIPFHPEVEEHMRLVDNTTNEVFEITSILTDDEEFLMQLSIEGVKKPTG